MKKVQGFIKLQVPAGKANPAPPIGPALGQHGVNIMEFCKQFNARTQAQAKDEVTIPVVITVYSDLVHVHHQDPAGRHPHQEGGGPLDVQEAGVGLEGAQQEQGREDQQEAAQGHRDHEAAGPQHHQYRIRDEDHRRYGALDGRRGGRLNPVRRMKPQGEQRDHAQTR